VRAPEDVAISVEDSNSAQIGGQAGAQLEAITGVKHHADTWCATPREDGETLQVVRMQA
jgi:hypothetical protein